MTQKQINYYLLYIASGCQIVKKTCFSKMTYLYNKLYFWFHYDYISSSNKDLERLSACHFWVTIDEKCYLCISEMIQIILSKPNIHNYFHTDM